MKKFEKKIQEQADLKKEDANKTFYGNRFTGKIDSSPNGEQSKNKIHTDKEFAKMAGVGSGTIARFNRVMNSDAILCCGGRLRLPSCVLIIHSITSIINAS